MSPFPSWTGTPPSWASSARDLLILSSSSNTCKWSQSARGAGRALSQTPGTIWGTGKHHSCLPVPRHLSGHPLQSCGDIWHTFQLQEGTAHPKSIQPEQGSTTLLLTSHPPVCGSVKATGSPLPAAEPWRIPAPAVVRQLLSLPWDSIRILTNEPATPHHVSGQFKSHRPATKTSIQ